MRKFILASIVFLALSAQAFAYVPRMEYFITGDVAIVRVWNNGFRPIMCSGMATGRTWQGMFVTAWMNSVVIYPNSFFNLYVYSNYYDPMAQVWANVNCY